RSLHPRLYHPAVRSRHRRYRRTSYRIASSCANTAGLGQRTSRRLLDSHPASIPRAIASLLAILLTARHSIGSMILASIFGESIGLDCTGARYADGAGSGKTWARVG